MRVSRWRGPRRGLKRTLAATMAMVVLAGCSGGGSDDADSDSDTLRVSLSTFEVDSPFPWETNMWGRPPFNPVMGTLVMMDPETGETIPDLAESWEPNDDYTQWTFKLREDVEWQGGYGAFTSADVVYTYMRGKDEGAAGELASAWTTLLASVEAPDPYTFVVKLKAPDPYFPEQGGTSNFINSEAYLTEVGDDEARRHPIGTGPYEFVEGDAGEKYVFRAVESHYRKSPGFKNLEIRLISDPNTIASSLRTGELDAAMVSGTALDTLDGHANFIEQEHGSQSWIILPWTETPDLADHRAGTPWTADDPTDPVQVEKALKVRQAMNLGFNKQAVVDQIWRGRGTTDKIGWYVAPWMDIWEEMPDIPGYDPDEAIRLLEEAGYPDGFTMNAIINVGIEATSPQIVPAFAQDMARIGIKVDVTTQEHATMVGNLRAGEVDGAFVYSSPGRATLGPWVAQARESFPLRPRFVGPLPSLWAEAEAVLSEGQEAIEDFSVRAADLVASNYSTIPIGVQSVVMATSDKVGAWPLGPGLPFPYNFEYAEPAN